MAEVLPYQFPMTRGKIDEEQKIANSISCFLTGRRMHGTFAAKAKIIEQVFYGITNTES
ncbi:hypothetical protein [Silvimonas soli]|uniref:hypothetical protein n=1 Tax=Silvimonas soli TaxID=2980100 RepID=UPI0024B37E4F|nr:hypothetical protein [Silvimonas soli]